MGIVLFWIGALCGLAALILGMLFLGYSYPGEKKNDIIIVVCFIIASAILILTGIHLV